jgi:tellurium resistance protein TerD
MSFILDKSSGGFKLDKGIKRILVGLGWKAGEDFDLDANIFGLAANGLPFQGGNYAICYANQDLWVNPDGTPWTKPNPKMFVSPDKSIMHFGDNRVGSASAMTDGEHIEVNLDLLPPEIVELTVFVTIDKAKQRGQSFSGVDDCYFRVVDLDTNEEKCRYNLQQEFANCICVQAASLVKNDGEWTVATLGDILGKYGLS